MSNVQISATPEEKRHYRLGDFPIHDSDRREFIFNRTGFSAKPMDKRGWYLFNRSMNDGLKLGLTESELQILSLMDHALADVKRFDRMPHMHEIAADSTAAHTKQVMNIIQHVFEKAFPHSTNKEMQEFRKKALLGAWLHDMGEIIMELTTANDMFHLNPEQRATLSKEKNALEADVVAFSIALASHCIHINQPDLFYNTIKSIRADALKAPSVTERVHTIRNAIQAFTTQYNLSSINTPETTRFMALYNETEEPSTSNFLHPFVKTLESVEGQRYLQRNSRLLPQTSLTLTTSHEIIESCKRCEKRLPLLHAEATTPQFKKLANAASAFTYRSLARQFSPSHEDYVSESPPFIHRSPTIDMEPRTLLHSKDIVKSTASLTMSSEQLTLPNDEAKSALHALIESLKIHTLETIRGNFHKSLEDKWNKASHNPNSTIYSRAQAGALFRAAEQQSEQGRFTPETASLISHADTLALPKLIEQSMRDILAQNAKSTVTSFKR